MRVFQTLAWLAAATTTVAAISFFGLLGPLAYPYLYLVAAAVCLAFGVWSLLPKNREASRDRNIGLAQAGCVVVLTLGPANLPERVNGIAIVLAALTLINSAFRMPRREEGPTL